MENINIVLSVLVAVLLVLSGAFIGNVMKATPETTEVVVLNQTVDLTEVNAKIEALDAKVGSLDEFEVEADEKLQNDTAKDLVLAELAKKAFMKDVAAKLNETMSIESYKDLSISYVKIEEVELDGEEAVVVVTIKVVGVEDSDEDLDFKAKLSVEFSVDGLDVDELDEAEIVDSSIELVKVYD